ncbi:MAG: zinc-dependent alcohol dehydrogenase family protein [Rhodospirillales bacterium]|nr:zinc-dependent alcohol dehydrogenase family protein [Rhodospirillales bacterium]
MARIVRFHELGGPDVLRIEEYDPGEPGPEEVRLRVQAIGLNRAEALFRAGQYLEAAKLPARIGYEAAGVVDAVGPDVASVAVGDAVSVIPAFSLNAYGTYGDMVILPAHCLVPTPAGQSVPEAAATWMQYLTAYGALVDIAGLGAGDAVIIPAASSSVGLAAIQIARMVGATAIATTRSGAKSEALRRVGAHHVIATDHDDLVAEVGKITDGQGARIAFDPVAGPAVEKLAAAAARGGTIFIYGLLSMQPTPFPTIPTLNKGLTMRGYTLFEIVSDADRLARGKAFVLDGLTSGALKPIIAQTFPLERIADAHRYMELNEQFGKIVVTVE